MAGGVGSVDGERRRIPDSADGGQGFGSRETTGGQLGARRIEKGADWD